MRIIVAFLSLMLLLFIVPQGHGLEITMTGNALLHQHLIETYQSQTFEPLSQTALSKGQSAAPSYQIASVNFITGNKQLNFGNIEFDDPTIKLCQEAGYKLNSCSNGYWAYDFCSENPQYFKTCCDNKYKVSYSDCKYPLTRSTDSCGGKYMCYCDRSLYAYTSCPSPKTFSGDSCTENGATYYSGCSCPAAYSQMCSGQNQQGIGTGCTQNGSTKYTSCQCKAGYNQVCSEYGPVTPTDYCLMNGIKYYNNCKTCPRLCSLAGCPVGASCTYEACSGKYCAIGCATGNTYWCKPPVTDCATLGYTKSTSQCLYYGYIRCPYNSAAVFCEDD